MNSVLIHNARLALPDRIVEHGWVKTDGERIASFGAGHPSESTDRGTRTVDASGRLLIPGLIDLHNDGLEGEAQPRPNARFGLEIALPSLESRLVSHGVTSIFHCISFMDGRAEFSRAGTIDAAVTEISGLRARMSIRHAVHARYEITETQYCPPLLDFIRDGAVELVSVMDHTPGQGQYRDVAHLKAYYRKKLMYSEEAIEAHLAERVAHAQSVDSEPYMDEVIRTARDHGLPVASHDDDSIEKVERMREKGVTISEFPVEVEVARHAHELGLWVVAGAPNVLLGKSNSGNMSAMDAVRAESVDALCSDYYSPSMLYAAYRASEELPLHQAINMVTLYPAQAAGIGARVGSIAEGKLADLALVDDTGGLPRVRMVMVGGKTVYTKGGIDDAS